MERSKQTTNQPERDGRARNHAHSTREKPTLILASQSPRRRQLLKFAGLNFECATPFVDEDLQPNEAPEVATRRLAREKALQVSKRHPDDLVLAADTLICLDGRALGKPASRGAALMMLAELSGRSHRVITGICLMCRASSTEKVWSSETHLKFKELDQRTIERYIALVHPYDKAGAYAIQQHGNMLIEHMEGLKSNVIGLPIEEVLENLNTIL